MEDLPDHLIHKIMHLLPYEEAAKFSVLSKSLYSYWLLFPTLNFSYKSKQSDYVSYRTFLNMVEKTLQLRGPHIKGVLHSLNLSFVEVISSYSHSHGKVFDVLLNFAKANNVKEINFDIRSYSHRLFDEQQPNNKIKLTLDTLLPLFSSQFLTVLKLTSIEIPPVDACIKCPELRELLINSCDGFRTINVSSSSLLKQVEVKYCKGLLAFQILDGKSLQSFEFQGFQCVTDEIPPCTLDISDCLALRVLKLNEATAITDKWLNQTIRSLSYLEELDICHCNLLEKIEFENYSLKKFTLWGSSKLKDVVADVPNLLEFNFVGRTLKCPIWILSSAKCKAHIELIRGELNTFFRCFDHFEGLSLSCSRFEDIIIPRNEVQINNLKHLKLEATDYLPSYGRELTKWLESLLRLMPKPETITLYSQLTSITYTMKVKCEGFRKPEKRWVKRFFANFLRRHDVDCNTTLF